MVDAPKRVSAISFDDIDTTIAGAKERDISALVAPRLESAPVKLAPNYSTGKKGRPSTGINRKTIAISLPIETIARAKRMSDRNHWSISATYDLALNALATKMDIE